MNLSPYRTTVVTAATSTEMTTVATVRRELGDAAAAAADEDIRRWIQQHSAAAVRHLNRQIAKETVLDIFRADWPRIDGSGLLKPVDVLMLSRWPVASITSVVEDGTTLTADDYEVVEDIGELWRLKDDARVCWVNAKISITYQAGWEMVDELPADLERAVIVMVKGSVFSASRDPMLKQESVPGVLEQSFWVGSVGDNSAIAPEALALLEPYRRISV